MKKLLAFIFDNFALLFALCVLSNLLFVLFFIWHRKAIDAIHPTIARDKITFVEKYASGFSHKNFITRFGGARNVLVVTVSNDAVLIEPISIFKWIMPAGFNDLEHYIPKSNILNIESSSSFGKETLQLEFRSKEGERKKIELFLRKPEEFLAAIRA